MRTHILRLTLFVPYVTLVFVMGLFGVLSEAFLAIAGTLDDYTERMSRWVNGF